MHHSQLELHLSARSDRGRRKENQDNFLIIDGTGHSQTLLKEQPIEKIKNDWPKGHVRLLLADGMGGHSQGREASEALVDAIYQMPFQITLKGLYKQLKEIHQKLNKDFAKGPKTPGSTLTLAEITPRGLGMIANIGDSRAYHCQDKQWKQLTCDHTEFEFAYRDHEIDQDRYQHYLTEPTGKIAQAMIYGSYGIMPDQNGHKNQKHQPRIRIEKQDLFYIPLVSGDFLWLGSDGLWSYHPNNQVQLPEIDSHSHLDQVLADQHQRAYAQGSKDNITSIVLSLR